MREVLEFPRIDEQKLESVKELIDYIAEPANRNCRDELERLKSITGKEHEETEFAEYWGWTDLDALAKIALTPEPPCIRDLTRTEVADMAGIIRDCLISGEDHKADYYIELLHKSLSLTNVTDYILSGGDDVEKVADDMMRAAASSVIAL